MNLEYIGRAAFNTENGKLVQVTSNVRTEDTDMIQIFTNLDTLVELTKNVPIAMEIPSFIRSLLTEV